MLTNRCVCCDRILTDSEMKFDVIMNDYNDMCNVCLKTARDLRYNDEPDYGVVSAIANIEEKLNEPAEDVD